MDESTSTNTYQESAGRRAWHELPAGVRWLVGGVAAVALYAALRVVPEVLLEDGASTQGLYLVGVLVLLAVLVAVGVLQNRRRLGGRGQPALLRRALREGRVPEGADRGAWGRELPRRHRYLRESRWLPWVSAAAFGLLVLLVLVAVVATGASPWALAILAVPALVLTGVLVLTVRLRRRNERRLGVLVEQLDASGSARGRG